MHSSPAFRAAGLALLALVSCARAGKPCSGGEFRCVAADEMLECHRGTWVAASCRGPGGCSVRGDSVLCDMSGNLEGDRCPFASEGRGRCAPDGLATIECRGGVMVRSNTCRRCALVNGAVNCEP